MNKNLKTHQEIGKEQELFFTDEIAPGAVFWLPKGMIIFKELEKYIRQLTETVGYQETSTPIMVNLSLFNQSGHVAKFGLDNMYNLSLWEDEEIKLIWEAIQKEKSNIIKKVKKSKSFTFGYPVTIEVKNQTLRVEPLIIVRDTKKGDFGYVLPSSYSLKPMNCPESTVIYRFKTRSYRELPLRFSELGRLFRREKPGEISGLLRVRQLTMDDAHIYVTENQILDEITNILETVMDFYKNFGFTPEFKLATRPDKFIGTLENWNKAEKDLEEALKARKVKYLIKEREGAFYGPKIDIHIQDSMRRDWQMATVQIDFALPSKDHFNLKYIDEKGEEKHPVIIHRAIFGSFERFIAILTEHFQGSFPLWLSPVQIQIVPITDKHLNYAKKIADELKNKGIRVEVDDKQETMQSKIREATLQRVPYIAIIGDKEIEANSISVRTREGKNLGDKKIPEFLELLVDQIDKKI